MKNKPTVLVTGYFDLLHSGHIHFLESSAKYGRLIVSIGSDENSIRCKGKKTVCDEKERKYMVESLRFVEEAHIAKAKGPLSFSQHLDDFKPEVFIINQDGHTEDKQKLCETRGVKYRVLKRVPRQNFKARSSTELRTEDCIPHRLDLAGGFFDQKKLNCIHPGSTITCNIEPMKLADRAGMSSSTRRVIRELFGNRLPTNRSKQEISKIILAYENFDSEYISGATDAYGLVFPGINQFNFDNSFHPNSIQHVKDNNITSWLEQHLFLKLTVPRPANYKVFQGCEIFPSELLKRYAETSQLTWTAIQDRNLPLLMKCINQTCMIQRKLIPGYVSSTVSNVLESYQSKDHSAKLMGAGGTGYMLIASDRQPSNSQRIVIRRDSFTL